MSNNPSHYTLSVTVAPSPSTQATLSGTTSCNPSTQSGNNAYCDISDLVVKNFVGNVKLNVACTGAWCASVDADSSQFLLSPKLAFTQKMSSSDFTTDGEVLPVDTIIAVTNDDDTSLSGSSLSIVAQCISSGNFQLISPYSVRFNFTL